VRNQAEEMCNAVQSSPSFVIGFDDVPGRHLSVRGGEHVVARAREVVPTPVRLQIHRAQLPYFPGIVHAFGESTRLFFLTDFKPVFDQGDSGVDNVRLPGRASAEKSFVFLLSAKSHHPLNAGAVVPTSVKDDDFTGGWEMLYVALDKNLRTLPLGRSR